MGLIVQLGHPHGEACAYPCPSGRQVVVVDIEGIHKVNVWFCGCHRARPLYVQMLCARWFPATVELPRTAVTFAVLQHFQMMTFMSKVSGYEYYHSLVRLTDNTGVQPPPVRGSLFVHFPRWTDVFTRLKNLYQVFLRVVREWRHIRMLKRHGRGNDSTGARGTGVGDCVVHCLACPRPGVNMAEIRLKDE